MATNPPKLRFRLPDSHPSGPAYQSQSTAYLRTHLILASSVLFFGITLCAVPGLLETGLCICIIAGLLFALIHINNPLKLLDRKAVVRYEKEYDLIFDKELVNDLIMKQGGIYPTQLSSMTEIAIARRNNGQSTLRA